MKNQPEAPQAPDYAAANEAGVRADVDMLPLRNAINAATTLGTSYTDPNTGKTYDFTGLGSQDVAHAQLMQQLKDAPESAKALLDIQNTLGQGFAQSARDQLAITDPSGMALRDQYGKDQLAGDNSIEGLVKGKENFDPQTYLNKYPDLQKATEGMDQQAKNDWATMHWNRYGQAEGRETGIPKTGGAPDAPKYESASGYGPDLKQMTQGEKPTLERMGDAEQQRGLSNTPQMQGVGTTDLRDTGYAAAGRGGLEKQVMDDLAKTGQMDPNLEREFQQAQRARGASLGNSYGDAGSLDEAMAVGKAQRELDMSRQQNALGLLQSGQTTSDKRNTLQQDQQASDVTAAGFNNAALQQQYEDQFKNQDQSNAAAQANFNNTGQRTQFNNATAQQQFQNTGSINDQSNTAANQSFQNAMAAIGQRNQVAQNDFGAKQGLLQQQIGARQQDTANKQSYLGLTPIVSQGAQLAGLQQGAAPTGSGTGYSAVGTAQNAGQLGTSFAGNIFGTQANIFSTQSQAATAANGQMMSAATSFMCHTARLVYGEESGRWVVFYHWKEHVAPRWFKALYNRYTARFSRLISHSPAAQRVVRGWMDRQINLAYA